MSRDEIFNKVKALIAEVLLIEDEGIIKLDSSLVEELGSESIDYVEIIHVLSREFDIDIERNDIYPNRDFLTDDSNISDGSEITNDGSQLISKKWPHIPSEKMSDYALFIRYLQTIEIIVDYIHYKISNA